MSLNPSNTPFLFSTVTWLAYKVDKEYYHNKHFVWCCTYFDKTDQPTSSNPMKICRNLIEQVATHDKGIAFINEKKEGILFGAQDKYDRGIITDKEFDEINQLVALADYKAYLPVVFVISTDKVYKRCENPKTKAREDSIEYLIRDLSEGEYEIMDLHSLINNVFKIPDKRADECYVEK